MESFPLNELIESLKNKSNNEIITILMTLKDDKQCSKYLLKNGALEYIVGLLSETNNQKIQNIILTILAKVCLLPEARNRIRETKLVNHVLFILKNVYSSDTLQCRASRLIGNLAECNRHAKVLYDAGAITILSEILRTKTNLQTYLTSIRAIRNIWNNHYGSREEIIRNGTIKLITKILVDNDDKKRLQETKYTELSKTCLKAMCAFLTTLNYQCADHMKGEKNDNGYKLILKYCKDEDKHAVKSFYFLSQIPECRPTLGNSGAVDTMIYLLRQKPSLSPEIIHSLCLFSREAINRARIRSESGIVIMLEILNNSEHEKYHALLLHALSQFIYDDDSIQIMVENGLVQVLTEKLNKIIIGLPNEPEEIKASIKRSGDTSPYRKMHTKFNRTNYGRFSMDYPRDDWSPMIINTGSSPLPFPAPYSLNYEEEVFDNADGKYSPICSDTEMIDDESQEEVESLQSFSSTNLEDDPKEVEEFIKINEDRYLKSSLLSLLSKLSIIKKPVQNLADFKIIRPLIYYVQLTNNKEGSRILYKIIQNNQYFILLIKQGLIFELQNLNEYEQYVKHVSAVAETGGAVGDLQSTLLRSTEEQKCTAAVSIPFIIKSKKILCDLLNEHGGIEIIFQILKNSKHYLHDKAVWAVSKLADTLNVKAEISDQNQPREKNYDKYQISVDNSKPSTITFELDDGTLIQESIEFLCLKSDFFSAMLKGKFIESGKEKIDLHNTSKDGLQTLLLAARGAEYHDQTIESLLDAVVLADKFLMTELSDILTESSLSKLNYENISRAWTWARKNSCSEMKQYCTKYFLTIKMTQTQRVRLFQDFAVSDSFLEFFCEIRQIITSALSLR